MMAIGDLTQRPYLLGITPGTGFGLYDMEYLMGELTYHVSLAQETSCIEPAIRVGYYFGRKQK